MIIIACCIGNKSTQEIYSNSTMPEKLLPKFNEEISCFLTQFFVVKRFLFIQFGLVAFQQVLNFRTFH